MKKTILFFALMFAVAISNAQQLRVQKDDGIYQIGTLLTSTGITQVAVKNSVVCFSSSNLNRTEFIKYVLNDGVTVQCTVKFNAEVNSNLVSGTLIQLINYANGHIITIYDMCPKNCMAQYTQL